MSELTWWSVVAEWRAKDLANEAKKARAWVSTSG